MKVLLITNLYPNEFDQNWGIFNYQQFHAFSKINQTYTIVPISWTTLRRWRVFWRTLFSPEEGGIAKLAYEKNKSVFHPIFFNLPFIRRLNGLMYYFSVAKTAKNIIKQEGIDVIIATWVYPDGYAAVKLGKKYRIPVYIKTHGSDIHSVHEGFRKRMTSKALSNCKQIISVSNSLSNTIQEKYGINKDKVSVIPNGIFKNKFFPRSKKEALSELNISDTHQKNIVFIGNLKEIKNIMMLVRAFHKLQENYKETIALHIIGSGVMRSKIEDYINTYELTEKIILHGWVSHEVIPYWMSYADLFVLPSKKEGMPNVVLEALSCGTPVVASDIDATKELVKVGVNGYLFDLDSVDDLVAKLDLGLRLKHAKEFEHHHEMIISWEESAKRLHQIVT